MSIALHDLRVLIVDDVPADAELACNALKGTSTAPDTRIASTRAEFVNALQSSEYDVVLADYRMAGWTGMDALALIHDAGLTTPVILVTGTLGEELAVECLKQGITDYVLKSNLSRLPFAVQRAVTERREQTERRRVQERFAQLADNISEVFFVMDADCRETLYINPAYEKIWRRSTESLYAHPESFLEPLPPEDRERLIAYVQEIRNGGRPADLESRLVLPSGEVRRILSHAVAIRNAKGEVYRICGSAMDVTDRRRAQEALEEKEALYRTIIETSFDGISISIDGIIIEANQGYAEMLGYPVSAVVGKHVLELVAEESVEEVQRRVAACIDGTYELTGKRKDGSRILLEVTARTHVLGGRTARITALRDLSEKRQLEAQFQQAQKMEAVGRLASGVAHDFNNLLTIITSYASMLASDMSPTDPRRDDLQAIMQAAAGATSLTRQLLAFSRQQVIQPRIVVLEEIVASTEKMLGRLIGEDIELESKRGPTESPIKIDPGQLEQVIMNLAVNARDAMPQGGKITIETGREEFRAGSASQVPAGEYARLSVSDTGSGMSPETQARIFEPFFTTKEPGKGTGLGLATVYGILKQSGGVITVRSALGTGTRFNIFFPIAPESQGMDAVNETSPETLRGSGTILVAEDAPAVRLAIGDILERFGYTVLNAPSASAALALAAQKSQSVSLLLTDVVMPGMSGRVLAEQFKIVRPNTPVLFMSGYTDDTALRHGVQSAGLAYLQKPFTPEGLARKVKEAMRQG